MKNIKQLIYSRLTSDSIIISKTGNHVYSGTAPTGVLGDIIAGAVAITYQPITGRVDMIGQRKELYQISVRSSSELKNEEVKNRVIEIFNRLKDEDFVYVFLDTSNEVYDTETKLHGIHLTFIFKLHDNDF